jgi:uncharacterized membrane protein
VRVENEIHIEAPPDVVWAVTEDVERWPEWTPTIDSVRRVDSGPFEVGSSARLRQPGMPEAVWIVTELVRGERFTWETHRRGLRMRATHELSAVEGGTRCLLRLELAGPLGWLLAPIARRSVRRALEQENGGLKRRCEAART